MAPHHSDVCERQFGTTIASGHEHPNSFEANVVEECFTVCDMDRINLVLWRTFFEKCIELS